MSVLKPSYSLPAPSFLNNHQPAPPTNIYHIDMNTDQGPWVEALRDLASGKPHITVMHIADVHFPFEQRPRWKWSVYQLMAHIQPDVVVGSDAADFAPISSFAKDPDIDEGTSDVLDEFDEHWTPFIQRLHQRKTDLTATFYPAPLESCQNARCEGIGPNRRGRKEAATRQPPTPSRKSV